MSSSFTWSTPLRITDTPDGGINDIFGYVEGGVIALDSGLVVVTVLSSDSYAIHCWAINLSGSTPIVGPDCYFNSDSNDWLTPPLADDPKLLAIGNLNHPVALGEYKFGITGEANESYNSDGTVNSSGGYGHVASIFSVDPDTLAVTRDHFIVGSWLAGEAVQAEATSARWGNKMVITSDELTFNSATSTFNPYKIWVIDSDTGALTIHNIPYLNSNQNPSAIAVAGDTAYWWQNDNPGGPYLMKSMALGGGSPAVLTSPGDPNDNNFTWYGCGLTDRSVVWTLAGDFGTSDYPLNIGFASASTGNIEITDIRDIGTGWTGGWYAPTRAVTQQGDDETVLVSYVEGGIFKYRAYTPTGSGLTLASTDVIADFSDSLHYYDYFCADTASLPSGGAVAMWISRHYNGGGSNFGIYISWSERGSITGEIGPGDVRFS